MSSPSPINGSCVWRGAEMARSRRWIRDLPSEALAELDGALAAARRRGLA
jgi:hypothetical protein